MGKHGGFHAGATKFVNGGGASTVWQSRLAHGLASGPLFQASWQHVTHNDFLNMGRLEACALHRLSDGNCAQFRRGNRGKTTHKTTHGGANTAHDDYVVLTHAVTSLLVLYDSDYGLWGASRYSRDCISSNRDSVRSNSKLRRPPE